MFRISNGCFDWNGDESHFIRLNVIQLFCRWTCENAFFFFLKCEAENLTNVDDEIIFKIDNTHTIKYINLFNWMWTWIEQQSSIMMSLLYWVACMCVQVCCWSNDVHTFQQAMVNIVCGGTYLMKLVKRWMRFTARYAPVLNKILASLESLCGRRAVACSFQSMSIYRSM